MGIPITPDFAIEPQDFTERFVRASGPGGQNVNKVATAVELRVDLGAVGWPEPVKARLRELAGARLTSADELVIDARTHRTQAANRAAARERLVALLQRACQPRVARRPSRPTRASRTRRLEGKRLQSERKRSRTMILKDE